MEHMHLRSWRGYAIIFALPAAGILCALWLHFATNPQNPGELEMSQANIEMLTGNGAGTEIHRRLQRVISTKGPFVIVRGQGALNTVSALKRPVDWRVSCDVLGLQFEIQRTAFPSAASLEIIGPANFLDPKECERLTLLTAGWLEHLLYVRGSVITLDGDAPPSSGAA